ncbi:hypothetical protein N8482_03090 [Chitinophagales bacterium]|nr:hypothetical protein [Chitinophagales bacterium]
MCLQLEARSSDEAGEKDDGIKCWADGVNGEVTAVNDEGNERSHSYSVQANFEVDDIYEVGEKDS